jgi:hypothetical protein
MNFQMLSGGQGPRAAALAWLEGQARRGFSRKPAHGARVKARRPHVWWARARRRQASSRGCRRSRLPGATNGPSGPSLVGIRSEDTAVGRALSGAVVSMLAASILAVLGILPSEAHILNSARHSVSIYRIPSGSDPSDAAPARACSHGAAVHP